MFGHVISFYASKDGMHVVLLVETEDLVRGQIRVPREALQQMLDAEPLYEAPAVTQTVTPS